jgi:hypothetical protein
MRSLLDSSLHVKSYITKREQIATAYSLSSWRVYERAADVLADHGKMTSSRSRGERKRNESAASIIEFS